MIYYYSATGNSAWVARQLAILTNDTAVDMLDFCRDGTEVQVPETATRLGFVFPVHAWRAPGWVIDFARSLSPPGSLYTYAVCTMAGSIGNAINHWQKQTGLKLDSAYSVCMPNNYILMSDRESDRQISRKVAAATKQLEQISAAVLAGQKDFALRRGAFPAVMTSVAGSLFKSLCRDQKFMVEDSCDGCGLCVRLCPLSNLKLTNDKPVWQGNCRHCMACLQNCPHEAIQYGAKTKRRQRYVLPTMPS